MPGLNPNCLSKTGLCNRPLPSFALLWQSRASSFLAGRPTWTQSCWPSSSLKLWCQCRISAATTACAVGPSMPGIGLTPGFPLSIKIPPARKAKASKQPGASPKATPHSDKSKMALNVTPSAASSVLSFRFWTSSCFASWMRLEAWQADAARFLAMPKGKENSAMSLRMPRAPSQAWPAAQASNIAWKVVVSGSKSAICICWNSDKANCQLSSWVQEPRTVLKAIKSGQCVKSPLAVERFNNSQCKRSKATRQFSSEAQLDIATLHAVASSSTL